MAVSEREKGHMTGKEQACAVAEWNTFLLPKSRWKRKSVCAK